MGVELSSVVGGLCAGVKVMYRESVMERGKKKSKRGKKEGELVSLETLHSMLWSHSQFQEILFSSLNSYQAPSAKGKM